MKIAIYSDTYPPQVNGVSMFVEKTERGLKERGHEVQVFSPRSLPSMPFWGYPGERMVIPLGFSLLNVHKFRPDIVHTHTPFGVGWEAVYAAMILGVPLVGTHHTFYDHYLKHVYLDSELSRRMSWKYTVAYYNRCDVVTCPTVSLAESLKHNGLSSRVEIVTNCIDTDIFVPPTKARSGHALVYIGRLSYEKSIDVVIKAFAKIVLEFPDATLSVVGDGPERKSLEALAHKLGLTKRVHFRGMLRDGDLVKALQDGDIFLSASASENMPLSLLEAMATGLPVVSVNALGVPEIVRDGDNGLLVSPNDPSSMAEAAMTLLRDENLRNKLGSSAHDTAQHYSRERVAEKLENIYKQAISSRK